MTSPDLANGEAVPRVEDGDTAALDPPEPPAVAAGGPVTIPRRRPLRAGGPALSDSGRHIVRGSMWFVAAVSTGAAFSFLFWALAAHLSPQAVVGIGSALWAWVQFMNFATGMGLPVAVARFGSGRTRSVNTLFSWALIYTAVTSLAGTVVFAVVAPAFVRSEYLDTLWQWGVPFGLALFFLLITGMSFAILVEIRLVTMRKWGWVFGRVLAISLLRLPFLYFPDISHSPIGLLLLIAGVPALSGFTGAIAIRLSTPKADRGRLLPLPVETMPAFKYASANYPGMLAAQAPQFVLPLVVAANVNANENAAFYLAWSVTVIVFILPHTIGQVVLSEGSRKSAHVDHQVKVGLILSLGLMVIMTAGAIVFASFGTRVAFGTEYHLTAELLPKLVAAGIPWAITCMCLAKARVEDQHRRTIVITLGFALFTLVPAAIMSARSGTQGAATAWLLGNIAAAVLAVVATRWVKSAPKTDLVPSGAHA